MKFLDNEFFVPIYIGTSRRALESANKLRKDLGIKAHIFSEKFNIFQRILYNCHIVKPIRPEFIFESLISFTRDLEDFFCPVILICEDSDNALIEQFRNELESRFIILDEKDFVIIKEVGKKKTCVCNLSMRTALSIHPTPKKKKDKNAIEKTYGKVGICYNYTQAMCSKQKYSILFSFNDKVAEIIFEPSAPMISALQKRIAENDDVDFVFD
jgi:hypothetical protein